MNGPAESCHQWPDKEPRSIPWASGPLQGLSIHGDGSQGAEAGFVRLFGIIPTWFPRFCAGSLE
jgi:hypothetical protein